SFRFWTTKPPDFGPNPNKTGVSSVPSRQPLTKRLTLKKGISRFSNRFKKMVDKFGNIVENFITL
ncbi:MAG: hypothetical protein ACI307_05515, partial [Sodaliphilus sp.]